MRTVLPAGNYQRLLGYERKLRLCMRRKKYIVNLCQTAGFAKQLVEYCPTLLTKTSMLWDMVEERAFIPMEHLCIMGINVFDDTRSLEEKFAVEQLALMGYLSDAEVCQLTGNGMHIWAIGSVLFYTMCGIQWKCEAELPVLQNVGPQVLAESHQEATGSNQAEAVSDEDREEGFLNMAL